MQDSSRTVKRPATCALPCRTSRLRAETVLHHYTACMHMQHSCAQATLLSTPAPLVSAPAYQHSPLRAPIAAAFLPAGTWWRVLPLLRLLLLMLLLLLLLPFLGLALRCPPPVLLLLQQHVVASRAAGWTPSSLAGYLQMACHVAAATCCWPCCLSIAWCCCAVGLRTARLL